MTVCVVHVDGQYILVHPTAACLGAKSLLWFVFEWWKFNRRLEGRLTSQNRVCSPIGEFNISPYLPVQQQAFLHLHECCLATRIYRFGLHPPLRSTMSAPARKKAESNTRALALLAMPFQRSQLYICHSLVPVVMEQCARRSEQSTPPWSALRRRLGNDRTVRVGRFGLCNHQSQRCTILDTGIHSSQRMPETDEMRGPDEKKSIREEAKTSTSSRSRCIDDGALGRPLHRCFRSEVAVRLIVWLVPITVFRTLTNQTTSTSIQPDYPCDAVPYCCG